MVMGEAELLARFAAAEPGSVAEVYRAYGRLVYTVALRVLGDAGLAEEATRRTFLQAWRRAPGFDPGPGRSLGAWLATIARRSAVDMNHHNLAFPAPDPTG
jgi:RNA polymerase sigma-70 factor (ECF subfamily)